MVERIPSSIALGSIRVQVPDTGPSLTQQEFVDQCDINHQIALFTRAGRPLPVYGQEMSLDQVQDLNATYMDAVSAVQEVEAAFAELPSPVRGRFDNDPLKLAQFLQDPANRAEAYKLGLVVTPPVPPAKPSEAPAGGVAAPVTGAQGAGA